MLLPVTIKVDAAAGVIGEAAVADCQRASPRCVKVDATGVEGTTTGEGAAHHAEVAAIIRNGAVVGPGGNCQTRNPDIAYAGVDLEHVVVRAGRFIDRQLAGPGTLNRERP